MEVKTSTAELLYGCVVMRTITALLLLGTAMSGQDDHPPLLVKPRAQTPFQVKNRPFEAQFEVSDSGGHQVIHGMIYRDGSGRVRTEYIFSGGERTTIISDPVVGEVLALDDVAREGSRIRQSTGPVQTGWAFSDCIPSFTDEYKTINDVRVRRVLLKDGRNSSDVGETWLSNDLMIVLSDTQYSGGIQRVWQISHVAFREPPVQLFAVPPHYAIVDAK